MWHQPGLQSRDPRVYLNMDGKAIEVESDKRGLLEAGEVTSPEEWWPLVGTETGCCFSHDKQKQEVWAVHRVRMGHDCLDPAPPSPCLPSCFSPLLGGRRVGV